MTSAGSQLSEGDSSAWEKLYDAAADRLFHYLVMLAGDREGAGEILQETFVRLFRRRDRLAAVDDLHAYLFTVARNEAKRWLRSEKARTIHNPLGEFACWDTDGTRHDEIELVNFALSGLNRREQEVVCLKVYSGFTLAQIARILDVPLGTCASRYRRALDKLKVRIQEQTQ